MIPARKLTLAPPPPASHTRAVDPFAGFRVVALPERRPRHEVLADLDAAIARKAAAVASARTLAGQHPLKASAWGNVARELERDLDELQRAKAAAEGRP